jgi:hypothetical protein
LRESLRPAYWGASELLWGGGGAVAEDIKVGG